jgi:hypothetical protein
MTLIERIVTVYNDKGSKKALKDLAKLETTFVNAGKKMAQAFGVAALAAGALAIKLGKDGVEAAIADQKSQALLANALRNTTGANAAAIASVEDYISAQQRAVAVTDDELRPSLTTLLNATKDVTTAQSLQNLALDIAAGYSLDLQTVSKSLAKAIGGNFGALTKLGVPLSADIKKSKDLDAALKELGKTFAGAASTRAGTFEGRMTAIRISFDDTLETLGYALIPVLEQLAAVFQSQILPVFEKFIANNKDQIAQTLGDVIDFAIKATIALGKMFKTISNNLGVIQALGSLLFGMFVGVKIVTGIMAIHTAISGLILLFKRQAFFAKKAGVATAFATGGATALGAIAALTAFYAFEKLTDSIEDNTEAMQKNSQVVQNHLADLGKLSKVTADANLKNKALIVSTGGVTKKTKEQIASEKALAKLKKQFQVVPTTEKDPIQLEAARLNLVRQGNLEEARRVEAIMKHLEAQMKLNDAAQRYADLLTVLSDSVISDEEVSVLAQKWGVTTNQVLEYIARIYAANSTEVNDGAVVNLLMKWGLTKEEAQKYVDFTRALKDEKIDDKEIEKLMAKWGMTRQGVLDYAKTVQDGTALQVALSKGYASPGDAAAESWRNALAALNAYLAALKNMTPGPGPGPGPGPTPRPKPDFVANPFNPTSAPIPKGKIEEQIDTLTSLRDATEKGTAISVLLKEHIDTLTDSISTSGLGALSDEQARLRAMGTFGSSGSASEFDPGSFRMADNAGMTINVNVAGNVQTEQDLADAIRQRILLEQASGKPILFVGGL